MPVLSELCIILNLHNDWGVPVSAPVSKFRNGLLAVMRRCRKWPLIAAFSKSVAALT